MSRETPGTSNTFTAELSFAHIHQLEPPIQMEIARPTPDEYNVFYKEYIDQVPDAEILGVLLSQKLRMNDLLSSFPESRIDYRYAEGKWSAKEVVGHIVDTEWILTYRALRMARNDSTPLAGMDQNEVMEGANFDDRTLQSLMDEFDHLRSASIVLFSSFDEKIRSRSGMASGFSFTVRALMYIIAGHVEHHMRVLNERYL
ncbi:MAG: DinB family protein [Bacteroidetes bacterium]|nr:DinB family protein [Bacteroidota bacterium]